MYVTLHIYIYTYVHIHIYIFIDNYRKGGEKGRGEEKGHSSFSCRKCGYSGGKTTDRMPPGNYNTYRSMNTDIEEKEGTGT